MSAQLESQAAWESGLLGFLYRQWFLYAKPVPAGTTLTGQVGIVTGANAGLGLEASRQLLQLGLSNLILAVRSPNKGEDAARMLRGSFPHAKIEVWPVDMESYDSITAFVKKCETLSRIDMVILNAGVQNPIFKRTAATGHEQTIQVNYISTILLTILLLPVLKAKKSQASAKPPVLNLVTSDTAYWVKFKDSGPVLTRFDKEEGYSEMQYYMSSKLMEQFSLRTLADQVNPDDVILNMVSPGWVADTSLNRDKSGGWIFPFFKWLMTRRLEAGGTTYVDAVVAHGKESHGSYIADWTIRPYPSIMYTPEGTTIAKRLWEETMEELNFAGVSRIVGDMARVR